MQRVSWLFLLVLLLAHIACAQKQYDDMLIPKFNIPYISVPPTIDGRIGAQEWRNAVKVMGVIGLHYGSRFIDRPVSFWVAWDAQHLYIATHSDILPGGRPYSSKREKIESGVVFDDSFEFGLFMHDRNKLPNEVSSYLKFIINSLGSGEYMKLYPSIGQNMFNWTPNMKIANQIYGEDGNKWWDMEIAADLKDLEMPVANKAGDKVDILLAADLKNPGWQWLDFPSPSGHLEHYGFPRAVLTNDQPYLQIEAFNGLNDGKLQLRSLLYNPSNQPVTVKTLATVLYNAPGNNTAAQQVMNDKQSLTIPANSSVRFDLDKDLSNLQYTQNSGGTWVNSSRYHLEITPVAGDGAPIYFYTCDFSGKDTTNLVSVPRPLIFECDIRYNPANGLLLLSGDTLDCPLPVNSKPVAMTYTVTKDGQAITSGRITQFVHLKFEEVVQLPVLQTGQYKVHMALVDEGGKELIARDDLQFAKKDEAKEFASWWNNKLGDTGKVLQPFTALRVKTAQSGATVTCTRREYQMDGLGLPRQIIANNGKLLTRPVRLVLTVAGKEYPVPVKGKLTFTSVKDWRVEFTGAGAAVAGVRFSVNGWMEQDGLVNLNLSYAPLAKPVLISNLRVEWPIDGTQGSWMSCIGGTGGNYSPRSIGKVPAGKGIVWNSLDNIGKVGSTMLVGNFMTNLWVGNEFRGLCWFADNDKGWVPNDQTPAHSLVRNGKEVAIWNNLISQPQDTAPFVLDKPRTVQLMYNATPFRYLAKGWRLNQVSAANGFSAPNYKTNEKTKQEYFSILSMPSTDIQEWPFYYAKYKAAAEEQSKSGYYSIGPRLTLFTTNQIALRGYMDKTTEPGLYDYFRADWVPGNESLNKSYTDYCMYLMNRHIREGGVTHYYFDISFSRTAADDVAGFGYRLTDGRVQPGSMDGTLREWYKRTWALMQENNLYPGGVSGHATNSICLRALPFADAILDSEYPMQDPVTVYPPDRMIAMSYPQTFGVVISHLHFMNPHWAGMHDASFGGGGSSFATPEFRHFGITRDDVQFVPYWRNAQIVKNAGQGLITSIWKRPGAAILAVMNYGLDPQGQEKTRQADYTLNLRALGIPKGVKGEQVRVRDLYQTPQTVDAHLNAYKWYQDMPEIPVPNSWAGNKARLHFPAKPVLDLSTGRLTGVDINYHEVRYVLLTWDEQPINDTAWQQLFTGDLRASLLEWGINRPEVKMLTAAETSQAVQVEGNAVQVQTWRQPGSVLLRVYNSGKQATDAVLTVQQAQLGVQVSKLWEQFVQCLGGTLDAPTGKLTVKGLQPGEVRLVYIDRN